MKNQARRVKIVVSPLLIPNSHHTKFRYYNELIYVGFAVFGVEKVVEREWGHEVRITELPEQPILTYINS